MIFNADSIPDYSVHPKPQNLEESEALFSALTWPALLLDHVNPNWGRHPLVFRMLIFLNSVAWVACPFALWIAAQTIAKGRQNNSMDATPDGAPHG